MATPSTLRLAHPEIGFARRPEVFESRLRRFFRGKARFGPGRVSGWREEATARAIMRTGA